jgi:hypothetical protein
LCKSYSYFPWESGLCTLVNKFPSYQDTWVTNSNLTTHESYVFKEIAYSKSQTVPQFPYFHKMGHGNSIFSLFWRVNMVTNVENMGPGLLGNKCLTKVNVNLRWKRIHFYMYFKKEKQSESNIYALIHSFIQTLIYSTDTVLYLVLG